MEKYNCEKTEALLGEYLDGETDTATTEAIEAHINECEHCRLALEEQRRMRDAVRSVGVTAPADLHDKVMMHVHAEARINRRKRITRYISAVAAALILAVGVGAAWSMSGMKAMAPDAADKAEDVNGYGGAAMENGDYANDALAAENSPSGAYNADDADDYEGLEEPAENGSAARYEDVFSAYGQGFDGGYVIYVYGVQSDRIAMLAASFGVGSDGVAFVLPYSDRTMEKVTTALDGLGDYETEHIGGDGESQCVIVFIG